MNYRLRLRSGHWQQNKPGTFSGDGQKDEALKAARSVLAWEHLDSSAAKSAQNIISYFASPNE
jgi:hypothetical protein